MMMVEYPVSRFPCIWDRKKCPGGVAYHFMWDHVLGPFQTPYLSCAKSKDMANGMASEIIIIISDVIPLPYHYP